MFLATTESNEYALLFEGGLGLSILTRFSSEFLVVFGEELYRKKFACQ